MTQIRVDEAARIASQQTPLLPAKPKVQKQITDFLTNVSNDSLNIELNTNTVGLRCKKGECLQLLNIGVTTSAKLRLFADIA